MAIAVDGTRHDTLNKAAFSLGQLVAAGLLPDLAVITSLADAARMSGLPERDIVRIIRAGMAAGARHPRPPRQLLASGRQPRSNQEISNSIALANTGDVQAISPRRASRTCPGPA